MTHPLPRLALADHIATHLREELRRGRWVGQLPGVIQLAGELQVSSHTLRAALKMLQEERLIEDRGVGRRKGIVPQRDSTPARRALRFGIMPSIPIGAWSARAIATLFDFRRAIEVAGHTCIVTDRSLAQMKNNLSSISRCVKAVDADAWIVISATRPVLEWFAAQSFPVLAYGGRPQGLPVSSMLSMVAPAIESAVNALIGHGHRRIVLLIETSFRKPTLIPSLESYLSILEARGIAATDYNLPDFDNSAEGLESCLDQLFRVTPPTALIVHLERQCVAVFSFLSRRGLRVPQDVSVICMFADSALELYLPPLDQFRVPLDKYVRSIGRWVEGVAINRPDHRQVGFDAVYVPGGTVGPAKK